MTGMDSAARPIAGRAAFTRRTHNVAGLAFIAPALALLSALFIAPVVLSGFMSVFDWPLFGDSRFVGPENYAKLAQNPSFLSAVRFTVLFAVLATVLACVVGFALALLVSGSRRGTGVVRTAAFLPVVVGMASASFLWIWLYNEDVGIFAALAMTLGLADTPPQFLASPTGALVSIVVMTVWKTAGFAMVVFLVGLHAIPAELQEAAAVDGAGSLARLRYITVPLLRPTIALLAVLLGTQNLLAFDQFFLMTRGGPFNSTITAVYTVYSEGLIRFNLGYAAAISLVILGLLGLVNAMQLRAIRHETGPTPG